MSAFVKNTGVSKNLVKEHTHTHNHARTVVAVVVGRVEVSPKLDQDLQHAQVAAHRRANRSRLPARRCHVDVGPRTLPPAGNR